MEARAAALLVVGVFALGKLKFLVLGLTKASTFFSMFAFFGLYWSAFGWALAADSWFRSTSTKWDTSPSSGGRGSRLGRPCSFPASVRS